MTISRNEVREDYRRFIRHEAMRANCTEEEIMDIIRIPFCIKLKD